MIELTKVVYASKHLAFNLVKTARILSFISNMAATSRTALTVQIPERSTGWADL